MQKRGKMGRKKMKKAAQTWVNYLWLVLYLWPLIASSSAAAENNTASYARLGCKETCGDVMVPYPFGFGDLSCAKNSTFLLTCNHSVSPPMLMFGTGMPIQNISPENSSIVVHIDAAFDCYNETHTYHQNTSIYLGTSRAFMFSNTRNKFTAIGCDVMSLALMGEDEEGDVNISGCSSLCVRPDDNLASGSTCLSSAGCCQTTIQKNLKSLAIDMSSYTNHTTLSKSNACSYAFLLDTDSNFNLSQDINTTSFPNDNSYPTPPVAIEWVISSEPGCEDQCSPNADCVRSENPVGYRCNCSEGYTGNPYLKMPGGGCQDIDECKNNPCKGKARCKNIPGGFLCKCPIGMEKVGGVSCQLSTNAAIVAAAGLITLSVIISLLIFIMCKKKSKQNNFMKNGGELLKNQRMRIFSEAELKKATKGYDKDQLLGEGGFGCVYKGVLESNMQIAVKKPKSENKIEISQDFLHEISTVSQVNHKNVVKLLGLCLETKVPLLVYEFISNGALFNHIHDKTSRLLQSWKNRLRVATETALAIDYLHSLADPPIIHRDIKSMNILLDENYTAKVSDFGASVLTSPGQTALDTRVQGTWGYLDPEYMATGNLTKKSDVYSFGVLLVELLTGELPTSKSISGENIIHYFVSIAENSDLFEILGFGVTDESEREEIEEVAEIARRCLNRSGIRRPSMKEVADDLAKLKKLNEKFSAQQSGMEETEHLLGESSSYYGGIKPDSYTFDIQSPFPSI